MNICLLLWRVRPPKIRRKKDFVVRNVRKEKGVELLQTTRCFIENDTLFYWKRYVVFGKTIPLRGRIELSFFALCDTCDSKKVKSLLDARAYVREKHPLPWETHLKTRKLGNFLCGQNPHQRANNVKCLRGIFIRNHLVLLSLICKISGYFSGKCILSRNFHSLHLYLPIYK